jgi:hypothetical protein
MSTQNWRAGLVSLCALAATLSSASKLDAQAVPEPSAYTAPTTAVGATSGIQTGYVTFATAGTLSSIAVLTQGAPNLDFNGVTGGSCTTGNVYALGATCSVLYSFTPTSAGARKGGIVLSASTGRSWNVVPGWNGHGAAGSVHHDGADVRDYGPQRGTRTQHGWVQRHLCGGTRSWIPAIRRLTSLFL